MKIIWGILVIALGLVACHQDPDNARRRLRSELQIKYPGCTDFEFMKRSNGVEVRFDHNRKKYRAYYSKAGVWKYTLYTLKSGQIPVDIKDFIEEEFPTIAIAGAQIKETKDQVFYLIECVEEDDYGKIQEYILTFNEDFAVVSKENQAVEL